MKVRMGFVSNSSSSAFIMPLAKISKGSLEKLAVIFDGVEVNDSGNVVVKYSCGADVANKILENLFGSVKPPGFGWTNVS